ncbi:hypothetical protein PPYR_12191 [Photinus pyralis]|uniref:Uncharacterized protein n=1 Tax=Photinus pyralis TaxID=7054 RepID=A0A1Y1LW23_PHOPY|nr:tetratricopeptide repeat protein 17-like [Photinus pyralis]KAB0795352.1 hypothetical protein PPYR_12191 [Photinus pyralis]
MISEPQNITIYALYLLSFHIISVNSRTSTLWKLNSDETKVVEASPFNPIVSIANVHLTEEDPIFNIITSTVHYGQSWIRQDNEYFCTSCRTISPKLTLRNDSKENQSTFKPLNKLNYLTYNDEVLDCGKPVNYTYYDGLVGVANRNRHPIVPEPQISLIFGSKSKKVTRTNHSLEDEVDTLERKLKKAKKEKPKSVHLYNQIGNFWRIKGDARKAIECFRRALAVAPHNAEVLLNLARVLFTLQYLDDAIYLTRRSLEMQPPDKAAWQQYFTLGEIFKAYGHYQEASLHLKHTLEIKPGFEPAQLALKEMESMPASRLHIYTLVIIISLVFGVVLVILSSGDSNTDDDAYDAKPQRHFNRAMAMSTLRGFRNGRFRKLST